MYLPRFIKNTFHTALKQFPAVLLTGPRQSGKTTFLTHELKEAAYITFDDPLNRDFARSDANGFLDRFQGKPVILDEIQYVPEILQYIKIRIDQNKIPGRWIMTGSQQFHLMKNISETLAGRIAILELGPFALGETRPHDKKLEQVLWTGLFPEPACYPEKRDLWLRAYIQTYMERDVRGLENIRDLNAFETFINLCAACHAQEFHPAKLARAGGVSQPTIKSWSGVLEAGYLAIVLRPFFNNFGKRLVKTPKFYMSDPSLVCFLTRQPSPEAALRGSMGGMLFEGLIVSEIWKLFYKYGKKPDAYFWRSQGGPEVEVIIQAQGRLWPVEIKLTATPSAHHVQGITAFRNLCGKQAGDCGVLVCCVNKKKELPGSNHAIPWFQFSEWLESIIA